MLTAIASRHALLQIGTSAKSSAPLALSRLAILGGESQRLQLSSFSSKSNFEGQTSDANFAAHSLQRRSLHKTPASAADVSTVIAAEAEDDRAEKAATKTEGGSLMDRFIVTFEVTVSKIFPAGFGWQSASILADSQGLAPDTFAFAAATGGGDAVGVLGGHMAYYGLKKALVDPAIDMKAQLHTGVLLGSAAFCSGTAWQPVVNILQGAELNFATVFAGTWAACGTAFYIGLRAGRTFLSGFLEHVHEPTYENSKRDAGLSLAIGGATGFFVGTDAAYLPQQNFLIDVVGIPDGTPDLTGCAIAGSSTGLGFVSAQSVLNIMYPQGKCWNDPH